jgi:hypothetical protein
MLFRSTKLKHPSGFEFTTPLLVPSFSSKGFNQLVHGSGKHPNFHYKSGKESRIRNIYNSTREWLTDAILISAYDVYHNHMPRLDAPPEHPADFCSAELVFVDSGGYETSPMHDLSSAYASAVTIRGWDVNKYRSVLDSWPPMPSSVFVSFDKGNEYCSVEEQILEAYDLFQDYEGCLSDFLLKPESNNQHYLDEAIEKLILNIDLCTPFSIIGVTEKELGDKPVTRIKMIAKLRRALDRAGIEAPIHVFGALDPVSSCAYFIAGAEIFDGLTWLRYSYDESFDRCVYHSNNGWLNSGIDLPQERLEVTNMCQNTGYLIGLQRRLSNCVEMAKEDINEAIQTLPHQHLLKQVQTIVNGIERGDI